MAEEKAEESEIVDEELEEMLAGGQRRNMEKVEEAEPVDLLPIVDSVFGQVGLLCLTKKMFVPSCLCVPLLLHQVLWLIECRAGELNRNPTLKFKLKAQLCLLSCERRSPSLC